MISVDILELIHPFIRISLPGSDESVSKVTMLTVALATDALQPTFLALILA